MYTATDISLAGLKQPFRFCSAYFLNYIGAIKVLCWANNVIDLPVCTFFGSELATEIPPAGLKRPFCFCSVRGLVSIIFPSLLPTPH